MTLQRRTFQWGSDFEFVRNFLAEIYHIKTAYSNLIPSEFENIKYGPGGTEYLDEEDDYIRIWENNEEIIAVSFTRPSGACRLSIHPEHISEIIGILQWMEGRVRKIREDKTKSVKMSFIADDEDDTFITCLLESGYQKDEIDGDIQIRPVNLPVPDYSLIDGYSVRNAIIEKDSERYREVQRSVFPHIKSMSKELLQQYSRASFYQADLDIVATGPDSRFVAFCTGRIDPVSRIAELEPVGTHPEYRKLGLAKAVICECLNRLESFNPSHIAILGAAPTEGARRLYESVGFENRGTRHHYTKTVGLV